MSDVGHHAVAQDGLVMDCGALPATTVLVVDDSPFDRHLVGRLLQSMPDLKVVYACNGQEGLDAIAREAPAVILTDLVMPDIEGLDLVRKVRAEHPQISVILVTAHGSEEVAMQALRAGAANYIPKNRLARDLASTLRQVLAISAMTLERRRILCCMVRRESAFILENDPDLLTPLLKLIREEIEGMGIWDPPDQLRVGVALQEALVNALYHGNLEVSSDLRQEDDRQFEELARQRRGVEPYCSRRIRVQVQLDRDAARFVVGDDGPGYDTSIFDRPVPSDQLHRISGRGLLLIRTFMDQVSFNKNGNQITMVKYRSQSSPPSRSP
jgi:DNA-binding NarL/FixJ family response regulator/anti-sigma regulatory factor (Ser/Thr protein kinase)